MSTEDDDIREIDLGNNPGRCEFCASQPCVCEGEEVGEEENPSGKLHEAKKKVAALGLTLVHDVEYSEFIVKEKGSRNDSDSSYHTLGDKPDDLDDAVSTAAKMAEQLGLSKENSPEDSDECECYEDCECSPCTCEPCAECEEDCVCCCDCVEEDEEEV